MSKQTSISKSATAPMRYARICPNTNGWASPSGGNKYSGSGTFPGKSGFGFDEWLLGTPSIQSGNFKGYKAGFIQGFKRQAPGFVTNVSCYWIDGQHPRNAQLAITIKNCQRLDPLDAQAVLGEYTQHGFISSMNSSLNSINLVIAPVFPVDPLDIFNVVFDPNDVQVMNPHTPSPVGFYWYSRLY